MKLNRVTAAAKGDSACRCKASKLVPSLLCATSRLSLTRMVVVKIALDSKLRSWVALLESLLEL